MSICINLGTFHVLVTTYLTYTITGTSESSSFEIQVLRTELFWAAFKSSFLIPNIIAWILLVFIGKVEWRFWFIHPCRTITFEHFAVFNQTAFMVNCLRSGIAQSSSRRVFQTMTVFGCFLCFPHKGVSLPQSGFFPYEMSPHWRSQDVFLPRNAR